MNRTRHLRAAIVCIIFLLLFEAINLKQVYYVVLFSPLVGVALVTIFWFIGGNISRRIILKLKKMLLPGLLFLGTAFFLIYEPSTLLRQIVIFLSLISFYAFVLYYRRIPLEQEEFTVSVSNFLLYTIIWVAFLMYLVVYDLFFAFFLPIWAAMLIVVFFSYIIFYYYFWATSESDPVIIVFSTLLCIISVELFYILSFWRTELIVYSVILTTVFYVFLGILGLRLKKSMYPRHVLEYLIIGIVILIVVISTMSWRVF